MKFNKIISLLGASILLAGCGGVCKPTDYPFGLDYDPTFGYSRVTHAVDDNIKIDGVINEDAYLTTNHLKLHKVLGSETADLDICVYFGYEGVVFAIDVTENSNIYVNPNRATYMNSGIEMYVSKEDSIKYGVHTLEIDLVADGTLAVRRNIGGASYSNWEVEDEITPFLKTTRKSDVNGYSHELFISYDFFRKLGFSAGDEDVQGLYCDFVHIASRNFEGTDSAVDRTYYCFGENDLDSGASWTDPRKTYHFIAMNGFVSYDLYIESSGNGESYELHGRDYIVPKNSLTILFAPDDGELSSIISVTVNGIEKVNLLSSYREEGIYKLTLNTAETVEDISIEVMFK